MKRKLRRLLSVFTALCLAAAFWGPAALAAGNAVTLQGSDGAIKGDYASIAGAVSAAASGDTILLNQSITLGSRVNITKDLTLDGQGNTVTATSNTVMLDVSGGAKLTLRDITLDADQRLVSSKIVQVTAASLQIDAGTVLTGASYGALGLSNHAAAVMNGGEISGNTLGNNFDGSAVSVFDASTFTMNEGAITGNDNQSDWGGAILIADPRGKAQLNGGSISRNSAYTAPAITTYGTLELSGVTIADNEAAAWCGAVEILGGTTTMSAGAVTGNYAYENGGAIFVQGVDSDASFVLTGGEISGNQAEGAGGAGYAWTNNYKAVIDIRGGKISGNEENVYNGTGISSAFFLEESAQLKVGGSPDIADPILLSCCDYDDVSGTYTANPDFTPVAVGADFAPVQKVPLSLVQGDLVGQTIVKGDGAAPDPADFGLMDLSHILNGSSALVAGRDNELVIAAVREVIFKDGYYNEFEELNTRVIVDEKIPAPQQDKLPVKEGYHIEGWYTTVDFQDGSKWDFDADTLPAESDASSGRFVLYVKWEKTSYAITPAKTGNGQVSFDPQSAAMGDTVTLKVAPDEGYSLATITVKTADGKTVALTKTDDGYTFIMPAGDVTLETVFKEIKAPAETEGKDNTGNPATGDTLPLLPMMALAGAAIAAAAGLAMRKRRAG